ncbi:MAG: NAD-dependent DNA ligase LigA, partial [bacterium]
MSQLDKIKKEIEELREELRLYDYQYYVQDQPTTSDAKYDKLFGQLLKLEEEYPQLVTPDSPTKRVGGAPAKEFEPAKHIIPLLSLANAFSVEDLQAFDKRVK